MKIWKGILMVGVIMVLVSLVNGSMEGWEKCRDIDVQGGIDDLTGFPFLIKVEYDSDMKLNFDDIRFINKPCGEDGGEMPYEIDYKVDGDYALFWVKGDLIPGTNHFSMYYGNSFADSGENVAEVWDDNYAGVYHLSEGTGTTTVDSKGNGNGTLNGGVTWDTTGNIGNSLIFDGAGNSGTNVDISINTQARFLHPSVTLELFAKPNGDLTESYKAVMSSGKPQPADDFYWAWGGALRYGNDAVGDQTSVQPTANVWQYFGISYAPNSLNLYINSHKDNVVTSGGRGTNSGLYIGNGFGIAGSGYAWDGAIDEVRISNIQRSLAWTIRSYENSDFSLFEFGPEIIPLDTDEDGISDSFDNCPIHSNSDQEDDDLDGVGDVCDNCKYNYNPSQTDVDDDGVGEACDFSTDENLIERVEGLEGGVIELKERVTVLELWRETIDEWKEIMESWKDTIDDIINAMRGWSGFLDFWNWYDSPQECELEETMCGGDDRFTCVNYEWTLDETCEFGCGNGECLEPECREDVDCGTDYYSENYCVVDDVVRDLHDFGCANNSCEENVLQEIVERCEFGCSDGECNEPPSDNCQTKESDYECSNSSWGDYFKEKDYNGCKRNHGTSTECDVGFCSYRTKWEYCSEGCNEVSGLCN